MDDKRGRIALPRASGCCCARACVLVGRKEKIKYLEILFPVSDASDGLIVPTVKTIGGVSRARQSLSAATATGFTKHLLDSLDSGTDAVAGMTFAVYPMWRPTKWTGTM